MEVDDEPSNPPVDPSAMIKKELLKILNRLSDGNMDPMFTALHTFVSENQQHLG